MNTPGTFGELDLRDYLRVLSRQRWLVLSVFGLVVAATIVMTLLTPTRYESKASVLLRTQLNTQVFPTVGQSQLPQFVRNPAGEFAFARSTDFRNTAEAELGTAAAVTPQYNTRANPASVEAQVITFRATSSDPDEAQRVAQGWADLYLRERAASTVAEFELAILDISSEIDRLEAEKAEIIAPLRPIDAILLDEDNPDIVARLTAQRLAMQQAFDDELLPIRFQLRTLSDDLGRIEIARNLADRIDISARINTAAAPGVRVAPNPLRNLMLGSVLGILLGVGAALLNDSLRVRIASREDLELVSDGIPVLAEIPSLPSADTPPDQRRRRMARYGAEVERVVSSVAYQAAMFDKGLRLLVTSARLGEGKSTLVQQIAERLVDSHIDTIVLDADLRRPVLHQRFGVQNRGKGFGDLLSKAESPEPHLVKVSDSEHLRFLSAGAPTDAAASLLRRSFANAMDDLADHDGVLLVDSPPVLAVTDAEVMANSIDNVIVVVRAGVTTRPELEQTLQRLATTRASVLGIVLIGADRDTANGYGYGYGYGYGPSGEPPTDEPFPPSPPSDSGGPGGGSRPDGPTPVTPVPNSPTRAPSPSHAPVVPERPAATTPWKIPAAAPAAASASRSERPRPAPTDEDAPLDNVIPLWLSGTSFQDANGVASASATTSAASRLPDTQASPRKLSMAEAQRLAPLRNRRGATAPVRQPASEDNVLIDVRSTTSNR